METAGTILIVDDEPMNVKLLAAKLEASRYDILKAYSGEEALSIVGTSKPDVILLDVMMPGIDGFEVTRRLKSDPGTQIIPIVLVTALQDVEDRVKGLDAGADDFLSKPVNLSEVEARVRSMIKLKRLQENLVTQTAPMELHPDRSADAGEEIDNILIVDDDEKTSRMLHAVIQSAGFNSTIVGDAEGVVSSLSKAVPDLVLLDLLLPGPSGKDILRKLRDDTATQAVPVIIISSISDLDTRTELIDIGADDYLIKPFNNQELLARIRSNLRKYETQKKLTSKVETLFLQSTTDPLTELYNRRYMESFLEKQAAIAKRYETPFSMLMVDIDYFKAVNDTFGHQAGDSVLKELAEILKREMRTSDIVARYGGEEFASILTNTALQDAALAGERVRAAVEAHEFSLVEGKNITVSVGVSQYDPSDDSMDKVIKRADEGLYNAKENGRNRVEVTETPLE